MGSSTFSGPVTSTGGFVGPVTGDVTGAVVATTVTSSTSAAVGTGGTALTLIEKGTISVTITALAAAAEEDLDVAIAGLAAGDIVIVTPLEAAMETGVAILGAWVASAGNITVRVGNTSGSGLTGSTSNFAYCIIRS